MTHRERQVRLLRWVRSILELRTNKSGSNRPAKPPGHASVGARDADTLSRHYQPVLKAIEQLAQLSPDWDSYGAKPIHKQARARAKRLIEFLRSDASVPRPRIGPTSDGGVLMSWSVRTPDGRLDMNATVFDADDELVVGYAERPGYLFEGSVGDLRLLASRIRGFIHPESSVVEKKIARA